MLDIIKMTEIKYCELGGKKYAIYLKKIATKIDENGKCSQALIFFPYKQGSKGRKSEANHPAPGPCC